MAAIREIFLAGIETLFKVFEEAVKTGIFYMPNDDGFDSATPDTDEDVRCLFETFNAKDVEVLSFSTLIQPTDIKGLVPGVDITLTMGTDCYFIFSSVRYSVEGYELDPMSVMYTLLLRKV